MPLSLTYIILVKEQLQSTKSKPIFLQEKPELTINCQFFGYYCTVYITWSCCILSPLSLILKTSFEYPPVSIFHLLLTSWWPGVARWKFLNRIFKKDIRRKKIEILYSPFKWWFRWSAEREDEVTCVKMKCRAWRWSTVREDEVSSVKMKYRAWRWITVREDEVPCSVKMKCRAWRWSVEREDEVPCSVKMRCLWYSWGMVSL